MGSHLLKEGAWGAELRLGDEEKWWISRKNIFEHGGQQCKVHEDDVDFYNFCNGIGMEIDGIWFIGMYHWDVMEYNWIWGLPLCKQKDLYLYLPLGSGS